jgi:hypothetical protein
VTPNSTARTRDAELRRQRQAEAQAIADALAQVTARLRESGGAPNAGPPPAVMVAPPSGGAGERGRGDERASAVLPDVRNASRSGGLPMTEREEPERLPCGHLRARAYRIRRGPRLIFVCRACHRWFNQRPTPRKSPDLPGFVTADWLKEAPR